MSVSLSVDLPDQVAGGVTILTPLGGDGYRAPNREVFASGSLACDASGGTAKITINAIPRCASMVHWIGVSSSNTGNVASAEIAVYPKTLKNWVTQRALTTSYSTVGRGMVRPPPMFLRSVRGETRKIEVTTDNVNGTTIGFQIECFCFEPEAAQLTPWRLLVGNFAS